MKTAKVFELLGKWIYVFEIESKEYEFQTKNFSNEYPYFLNRVGEVKMADSDDYFDYRIYYPEINNSCLLHPMDIIKYTTEEENPEYFV
jgi:hypothetical protein